MLHSPTPPYTSQMQEGVCLNTKDWILFKCPFSIISTFYRYFTLHLTHILPFSLGSIMLLQAGWLR